MTVEERTRAVEAFGFTLRQARFLSLVMVHAGVCVERQYCQFAGVAHGQKAQRFFRRLVRERYAASYPCAHNRARIYHIRHAPLYRAIGEPHSRNRKPAFLGRAIERLMLLDGLLARPEMTWLATEQDKRIYFTEALHGRLASRDLPQRVLRSAAGQTLRFFPDMLPIAVRAGAPPLFAYLVVSRSTGAFRVFLQRHAQLLNALPEWTVCLLLPRHLTSTEHRYRATFRDEVAPLAPTTCEELRWYFGVRRQAPGAPIVSTPRYEAASRAFSTPRCRGLYRAWLSRGDAALDLLGSTLLAEAMARGTGRLDVHPLPYRYQHLLPLVGTA